MAASASAIRAGQAYVELLTKNVGLERGLRAAEQRLKAFGNAVGAMGQRLAGLGVALAVPFAAATNRFMQFDDQTRQLRAFTEGTEEQFEALVTQARDLGATSGFSAVQVAALMSELGRAGFARSQIGQMTTAVLNMARATGTDATLSAGIMSSAIRQFGLQAGQATMVADALTVAANASFTSVQGLGESLSYVGPDAARANMSLQDTLAILGTLGNIGIQGSAAGTALRRLLTISAAESQRMQEIFGVAGRDAAGNARPLMDVLAEITRSIQGLGTADQSARLNDFFGLLGITAAGALGRNIGDFRQLQAAINGATGAAASGATQMDAGIGGSFRRLLGAVEGVALSVGEALNPALQLLGQIFRDSIDGIRDWIKENKGIVAAITAGIAVVTALGVAMIGLGLAFKFVAFSLGSLIAIKTVFLVLLGAIKFAIGALVLAFSSGIGVVLLTLDGMRGYMVASAVTGSNALGTLGRGFRELGSIASETWQGIQDAMATGDMEGAMRLVGLGLQAAWRETVAFMRETWRGFRDEFLDIWDEMATQLAIGINLMDENRGAMGDIVSGIVFGSGSQLEAGVEALQEADANPSDRQRSIESQRDEERARRRRERDADNAADRALADAARRELEAARRDAAFQREWAEAQRWADEEMRRLTEGGGTSGAASASSGVAAAAAKMEAGGTFSAFAAGGMGAASLTKLLEEGNNNTAQIARNTSNGGNNSTFT